MVSSSFRGPHAGMERDGHVLRAVADYRPVAAHRLQWEERNRSLIAQAEQSRLLREAGVTTPSMLEHVRAALGTGLVRFGGWLQSRSDKRRLSDAVSAL